MRKTLSLFAATLLAAAALDPAWGQARGFAGTWVLDAAKSDPLPQGKGQGKGQSKTAHLRDVRHSTSLAAC